MKVISLGGSLIVPNEIDYNFLNKFKKVILKNKEKFVIVTGGGKVARIYINSLKKAGVNERVQCLIGIGITRLNARFMAHFFGKIANESIPHSLKDVKNLLRKNRIVLAGGLRFHEKNTSDGTAAQIAHYLKADFINMTNVKGLYNKDPNKYKDAKFIPEIRFNDFYKMVKKIKYKAGQHFVLDQNAAEVIKKYKIKTFIIGSNLNNLKNCLKRKRFIGTVIK